ncbi:MAG: glucosyltransferase domain-containing protein, partial [Lachnospiraceae bacterium]|nr:glucosyltransferase domain-containing protein [Lachnospiraceae bacterium]
ALSYLFCLINKESKPAIIFIVSATALIFPTFAEQYYFKFQSFEVMFGIFLSILSGIMFVKFLQTDRLYYLPIPVVLNVLSFGIYQSMLNIMLVICAGIFLMLFLSEIEYDKFKALIVMALQFIVSFFINQLITRFFLQKEQLFHRQNHVEAVSLRYLLSLCKTLLQSGSSRRNTDVHICIRRFRSSFHYRFYNPFHNSLG